VITFHDVSYHVLSRNILFSFVVSVAVVLASFRHSFDV